MDNATIKILLASSLVALGAGAAMAKGSHGGGERMNFETLDVDGSGEITVEDLTALRDNRFADIDTDGNGSVTEEEFTAAAAARAAERAAEQFANLDADGDGVLSRDVLENRGRRGGGMGERMISRLDTDASGGVSAEEFEVAKERMSKRRMGGERGERGDGKRRN